MDKLKENAKNLRFLLLLITLTIYTDKSYSSEYILAPNTKLLGLLIGKDAPTFEENHKLYNQIENTLTKLNCTSKVVQKFKFENGYQDEKITPEDNQYFAFNDNYFFIKYSSDNWVLLDDIEKEDSYFKWGFQRINSPLGNTDISFLSEDINDEANLIQASEEFFINRTTGKCYWKQTAAYSFPKLTYPDFNTETMMDGNCAKPSKNKF